MKYLLNGFIIYGGIIYLILLSVMLSISGITFIHPNILIAIVWVIGITALVFAEYMINKKHLFG